MRRSRSQPIRPKPALTKSDARFLGETTNQLSYKHIGNIPKTKPIIPRQRPMIGSGRMESVTTIRQDYPRKYVDKPEIIIPCGNIRLSSGKLDASTTAKLSYADPGCTEPTLNFKPIAIYYPPSEPILTDTTQKLSYQPVHIPERDTYSWQQKPIYQAPDVAMCGKTTYSESFLKNEEPCVEKPVRPTAANVFPIGGEFRSDTIYKQSYLQSAIVERVEPVIPCNAISKPDGKISTDTTSKLSYLPVQSERRLPILPRSRNMIGDGLMQSETTNRCDFVEKNTLRPDLIIPCDNLRSPDTPIDDRTTTKLSYAKPGPVEWVKSFKPVVQYQRSEKIAYDTINKLSYQSWTPLPKEHIPWASKEKYQPPSDPMCADTIYQVSYPPPGYYEDTCMPADCECLDFKYDNLPAQICETVTCE
ncbi:stabilizer of axonemal microtubules 1 [Bombus terrestris]|uniref:Stabilizer of axonemal microtubules 1 n=1 Tax=Bombus terrestris TaxID=30195 RepID=A0A9B2JWN5_BOMTE|nr:stabilizer of axonemal microtubules 1 [Bombus terrestris]